MSTSLIGALGQWGWASETTVGTAADATIGIPNIGNKPLEPNQEYIEDFHGTGKPVLTTSDVLRDVLGPQFAPETAFFHPQFGEWLALLTQNVSESGAGPYVQAIEPSLTTGYKVVNGSAGAAGNRSGTIQQKLGQTTSRDVTIAGCVVSRIDVTIPQTGRVSVTPTFMALGYDDADDASGGTFTLPGTTIEKMATDFVYKIGDSTPASLYSRELSMSFIADIIPLWYAGNNGVLPYGFLYKGWSLEGSFTKPILAAADTLSKDFVIAGTNDQLLYVYSTTLTDYSETAATFSDGEVRFTLNVKLDTALPDLADDQVETVNFKGIEDGTNNIFLFEQATTATQAWAGA